MNSSRSFCVAVFESKYFSKLFNNNYLNKLRMKTLIINSNNGVYNVVKTAGAWARLLFIFAFFCAVTITAGAQSDGDINPIPETNLTWSISGGTLIISGTGEMTNAGPWAWDSSITDILIDYGVTTIADGAFYNCTNLTSVIIPNSVTSIGAMAFGYCSSLTYIDIPNSVTSIGDRAFDYCSGLTSVFIPSSVTYLGEGTFLNSAFGTCPNLISISVDINNNSYSSENGILFDKAKTTLVKYPIGKIGSSYTIPNSVTSIGNNAFLSCKSLTYIDIPNSVTSIGSAAFINCSSLTYIDIPNSVTSIGETAFYYCSSLSKIINYATTPQSIDGSSFTYVDKTKCVLLVPLGSATAYRAATNWNYFSNIVEYPHYPAVTQPYPDTMTFTTAVMLNGTESQNDHLEIGAFSGSECRGSADLQNYPANTAHPYLGFLSVHGNGGESITFRVFDYDTGNEYAAINSPVVFTADAIIGNPSVPCLVVITDTRTQTIPLSAGWSWISVNIAGSSPSLLDQFKTTIGSAGNLLKGQSEFIQTPGWIGTLSEINNAEMYMVNTTAAQNLSFTGLPADPASTPVSLLTGWNWIGYVPQASMPLADALAGLIPQDGDQIKSRTEYSVYSAGSGWTGSLSAMNPGEGYKYYSANAQTLVYPSTASSQLRSENSENALPLKWTANANRFPNTMTLTSVVLSGSVEQQSNQIEIDAFCGDECRGSAMLKSFPQISNHPYLGFLVVYGDSNESISFRIFDHATGQEYNADNASIAFASDTICGSPAEPFKVMFSPTGIRNIQLGDVSIFLDSSGDNLNIRYPWNTIDQVEIVDMSGRIVWQTTGFTSKSINISSLAHGAYVLKLVKDNQVSVYKFVKK